MKNKLTDEELVKECLKGNLKAFDKLIKRYEKQIYNLIYRIIGNPGEAMDITQETFLRAFKFLKKYNPDFKFHNWLLKIATNLSINEFNKQKEFSPLDKEYLLNQINKIKNPEKILESKELKEYIQKNILSLPIKYRIVVLLRHIQDFTYEEISLITGLPLGTVKAYLFRAKEILKNRLKEVFEKY